MLARGEKNLIKSIPPGSVLTFYGDVVVEDYIGENSTINIIGGSLTVPCIAEGTSITIEKEKTAYSIWSLFGGANAVARDVFLNVTKNIEANVNINCEGKVTVQRDIGEGCKIIAKGDINVHGDVYAGTHLTTSQEIVVANIKDKVALNSGNLKVKGNVGSNCSLVSASYIHCDGEIGQESKLDSKKGINPQYNKPSMDDVLLHIQFDKKQTVADVYQQRDEGVKSAHDQTIGEKRHSDVAQEKAEAERLKADMKKCGCYPG